MRISPVSYCSENLPVTRGYMEAQNNTLRISWKYLWHRSTSNLRPGKPLLDISLSGVGPTEEGTETFEYNLQRICDVLSGGPKLPSHIHHQHYYVTPAQESSGVGWAITIISIKGEKGNKQRGWRSWYSDVRGANKDVEKYLLFKINTVLSWGYRFIDTPNGVVIVVNCSYWRKDLMEQTYNFSFFI